MNTANKLTLLRVALIPFFLAVLYIGFPGANFVAMAIFTVAGCTDFIDGYIARSRDMVTDFGKFLDPLADKALVVAAMLWFLERGLMPAWAVLIVVVREFMVTALRLVAVSGGRVIAAGNLGKIKTAVTMLGLIVLFLPVPSWAVYAVVAAIVIMTVLSGAEYFIKNRDVMRGNQ